MKPLGLISKVGAIGISIAIVMFFVRPLFSDIGEVQNQIQQYAQERERVTQTNSTLAARVSQLESISVADRERLTTFMPTFIDEVAVLRDLEIMANDSGVTYSDISYNGEMVDKSEKSRLAQSDSQLEKQEFAIAIEGNYTRIKDFFSLLEQNHYPLQVYALNISQLEGSFLTAEASIITYVQDSAESTIR